jgi:hypothetical protein
MYDLWSRRGIYALARAIVIGVGTVIAEGPVAAFIRRWSPTGAAAVWMAVVPVWLWLIYMSVLTAERPVSLVYLGAGGLLFLVMVFVHFVRAEAKHDRERAGLRLTSRARRPKRVERD